MIPESGGVEERWLAVRAESPRGLVPARLRLRRAGDPGSPRKVLLLHGVGITGATWARVMPAVAGVADVVAADMLGFGGSSARSDVNVNVSAQVRLLPQVLDGLGWGRGVLVGHSMGGAVGLGAALAWPRRVAGLVQVAGAGLQQRLPASFKLFATPGAGHVLWLEAWLARLLRAERLYGACWSPNADTQVEFLAAQRRLGHNLAFWRAARDLRPARFARVMACYPRIACPTLILHGTGDPIVPVSVARRLAALLPDAELRLFEGCGHMPQEYPQLGIGPIIAEFLTRRWPSGAGAVQ
jgi:pimeloyl-ACP methyl ester carboxylesterase